MVMGDGGSLHPSVLPFSTALCDGSLVIIMCIVYYCVLCVLCKTQSCIAFPLHCAMGLVIVMCIVYYIVLLCYCVFRKTQSYEVFPLHCAMGLLIVMCIMYYIVYCVIVFFVKHNLVKLFNCTVRWVYSSFCVKHNLIKLLYLLYCKAFSTALCEGYSYHNVYCVLD